MQLLFVLLFFNFSHSILAQDKKPKKAVRIEAQPQYTKWQKNYSISKISFFENRVVLDLEFIFERGTKEWTRSVIFMPPNAANSWCLKDPESGKVFDLLEIKNVQRNGVEIKARIKSPKDKVQIELPLEGIPKEVFTCQVHFPKLPNTIKTIDLLEGADSKYSKGHWNFFAIQLKPVPANSAKQESVLPPNTSEEKSSNLKLLPDNSPQAPILLPSLLSIEDIECNKILELREIVFQDNSIKFQSLIKAERALSILRTYLQQYPNSTIELYGHTDIYGTPERNLSLSRQRVKKLKDWFIQQGILTTKIQTHALGNTQPLFPNGDAKNRRVEVKIVCTLPTNKN
jgi:outer membrane protein OmpA-like peptidoglycan-associated protein